MKEVLINRLRSWGNKSIGLILFVVCLVAIYNKVTHNENLNQYSTDIKIQFEKVTFFEWAVLLLLFLCVGVGVVVGVGVCFGVGV